jgi:hypothetical protein
LHFVEVNMLYCYTTLNVPDGNVIPETCKY